MNYKLFEITFEILEKTFDTRCRNIGTIGIYMVYKIVLILILGFGDYLIASPTECNRQAREAFTLEKKTCDSKKSDDKQNCMKEARDKLKTKNSECRQVLIDCTSKARETYKQALSSCRTLNGNDKKNCTETAKKEFNSAEIDCKKK